MTNSIAVIGEAVADAVAEPSATDGALRLEVRPGGGPANTAVALARLGSPTRFFGRLSSGVLGQLLRTHLEKSMVDLSGSVTERREATLAIAAIDDSGGAAYDFYIDGTADWQWNEDELAAATTSSVVHTGSLALVLSPGAEAITATLRKARPRATVSIDPNVRPAIASAERYRRGLDAWASLADILKLSQDDLDFTHPGTEARRLCERWHTLGCRLIVITRGAEGAVASLDGDWVKVAARRVHVADTIGAGDAFTAGLLHRLAVRGHHGGRLDRLDLATLTDALELAALVAARCCEAPGADPPWVGQLGPGH